MVKNHPPEYAAPAENGIVTTTGLFPITKLPSVVPPVKPGIENVTELFAETVAGSSATTSLSPETNAGMAEAASAGTAGSAASLGCVSD